jgi:cysteinyl-tRNA synthetase
MQFHNTLTRRKEEFVPGEPGHARLYTCGPTVYNYAHIGNFRAYMFEDVLRRALKLAGFRVTQVMNLTDVDDKTIRGARAAGVALNAFTRTYKDAFFADLKTLGIEPAEVYPAATDHIPAMIALIQTLLDKGVAYRSDDGSVYFSVAKFPHYGCLAHLDLSGLRAGARVAQDEYEKESVGDFAVWKAWDKDDGDVAWDSPWGRGRPGWHIECSAMGMQYLGESFDIHTGGIDNLFPHHENEIAQSEAATGKPFVTTWLHCAHLRVHGEKMSKSLGNFFTLRDLLEKGYTGREIRYVLISAHYRQSLNFTFDALVAARTALARVDEFSTRLREAGATPGGSVDAAPAWAKDALAAFREAIFDDLNVPPALAAVHGIVTDGNRALDAKAVSVAEASGVRAVLAECDRVLNVLQPAASGDTPPPDVQRMADERVAARKAKDFAASDRLRDAIAAAGWEVRDTPQGPKLKRVAGHA